ncbi:MAG: class I SAM-dependent methyltransferase [Planctomycetota bacterium]
MNFADFYDAEAACCDDAQEDVQFLLSQLPGDLDVLDACCGTGRVSAALAAHGHRVTAVDNDPDALAVARTKTDAVAWHHADALAFRTEKRFDAAVLMFNDLGLFWKPSQQRRLLRNLREHVTPGGVVWVDMFMPDLLHLAEPHEGQMPIVFDVPGYGAVTRTSAWEPHPKFAQVIDGTLQYRWFDNAGGEHFAQRALRTTWFMPRELQRLLRAAGFRVEQKWGDHDGSELTTESPRIIIRAVRM